MDHRDLNENVRRNLTQPIEQRLRVWNVLQHITSNRKVVRAAKVDFASVANNHYVVQVSQAVGVDVRLPDLDGSPRPLRTKTPPDSGTGANVKNRLRVDRCDFGKRLRSH